MSLHYKQETNGRCPANVFYACFKYRRRGDINRPGSHMFSTGECPGMGKCNHHSSVIILLPVRQKNRRFFQDFRFDQLNFEHQEKTSAPSSRFGSIKNSPELEIVSKHWAVASGGFPPGVTVDELKKYGRRKQLTHLKPQDNLQLEEGSLKPYKSEYKRRFVPFLLPKVSQTLNEDAPEERKNGDAELFPKYPDSYVNYTTERPILQRPQNNLQILKDQPMESLTEKNSKYILFPRYERRKLLRRSTALKPEGEIACETEVRKEYVDFKNPEKARLIRKLPSLKLEGEHEPLTTEQRDKFIAYLLSRRPVLEKKKTSLKMEGTFDFLTEKKLSYVPHEFPERPRIRKRSTSLKLEGEVEFSPEYRNSFVDFPRSRPVTYKPDGKIRHEGEFESKTETRTQFVDFKNVLIPQSAKPENNLHIQGEMEISPEYRNNFVDFPRERPFLRRPFNQIKPEGNLELLTENSEKFSNSVKVENSNKAQRTNDLNIEKNLDPSLENKENLIRDKIHQEDSKPRSDPEPESEKGLSVEKSAELGKFSERKNEIVNRKPLSLKQENELFFTPEIIKAYLDAERERNLKLMRDIKSNAPSPRKKSPKGKTKLDFENNKKSNSEISVRKSSVKRLKEGSFEFSEENVKKPEEGRKRETQQIRQNLRFPEIPPPIDAYLSPKEFPAFKVLDVKGQLGCQSMSKDPVGESEKSTSDDENPTYRLEVSNSGERSPGFYRSNRRIFPEPALDSKRLEEAERRAKQRAENYVKIVKSPEIPNCLLDKNNHPEMRWKVSENSGGLLSPQENLNSRSFVILDDKGIISQDRPRNVPGSG